VVIPAIERSSLPGPAAGEPVLTRLYGDVVNDGATAIGRALLIRGLDDRVDAIDVSNIGPGLASPAMYRELAAHLDELGPTDDQPLVRFAAGTAADGRRFAELLEQLRGQL